MKTTCYHARNLKGEKVLGGMMHASSYDLAAEKVLRMFDIGITDSARVSFMKDGKPVHVYLSVSPDNHPQGVEVYRAHCAAVAAREAEEMAKRKRAKRDIEDAISEHGIDAVLGALSGLKSAGSGS